VSSQHALARTLKRMRGATEPNEPAELGVLKRVVPAEEGHVEPGAPTALQACYFQMGITGRSEGTREAIAAPLFWEPRTEDEQRRPSQRQRLDESSNHRSVCHGCGRPRRECGIHWGKDTCKKLTCRCGRLKTDHPGVPFGRACTHPVDEGPPPSVHVPPGPLQPFRRLPPMAMAPTPFPARPAMAPRAMMPLPALPFPNGVWPGAMPPMYSQALQYAPYAPRGPAFSYGRPPMAPHGAPYAAAAAAAWGAGRPPGLPPVRPPFGQGPRGPGWP